MFSEETKKKGKFSYLTSEGNGAFPLSFNGENSHGIRLFLL